MLMKRKRLSRKIVCAFSLCIFSLLASFAGSYAWFFANNQVTATDAKVKVYYDDIEAKFFLYKFSTDNNLGSDKNEKGETLTIENFALNTYDTIFKSKNQYTPGLLRVQVTGSALLPNGRLDISLKRDDAVDAAWTERTKLDHYISSIVGFKAGLDDDLYDTLVDTDLDNPIDSMFKEAVSTFRNGDYKTFTSYTTDEETQVRTYDKVDAISFSVNYTTADWVTIGDKEWINIYIYFDYEPELVKQYAETDDNFSAEKLKNRASAFNNDLSAIIIDHN